MEDHPLQYLVFEGAIPKGQYGGGTMIVWDRGRWTPEGDPRAGYAKGHLAFTLEGERLKGRWHLVRTKPRGGKEQWLLLKSDDAFARAPSDPDILEEHAASVLSGRTNGDLEAAGAIRSDHQARTAARARAAGKGPDPSRVPGARKGILPPFVEPCLATLVAAPPAGPGWVYEIKLDGYRLQARIEGDEVRLLTRSGLDWTQKFGPVARALKELRLPAALIDGELVAEDETGRSDFSALQADLKSGRTDRMVFHAFDLLHLDGHDLRGAALLDRKALLARALDGAPAGGAVRGSEHLEDDGAMLVSHACRLGLEGMIAKRGDAPYRSGRGETWLKLKCAASAEFVIGGFTPSTAVRGSAVGSLILGVYEGPKLVHVGRTGTGFTVETARDLWERLRAVARPDPPFAGRLPAEAKRNARWAEPRLVATVEFRGWTGDGALRHAAFKGLREDRDPQSVARDVPAGGGLVRAPRPGRQDAAMTLTHPDRVLWPDVGLTKQGLAEFYTEIADWVLPEIVDRPLSLVRCPDGTGGKCFFQKHAWAGLDEKLVRRVMVGDDEALAIRDLPGLLALVQASVLEIHPWGSKLRSPERPDRLTFDLDPGEGVGFDTVAAGALEVRERLSALGLESLVKTTGGKGLHVVVPLKPKAGWDEAKAFCGALAASMAADAPERYVATLAKRVRAGRIFVDYLRNGRGATAVAAYSTRARPGAPVATPLSWDELPSLRAGNAYRVATLPARLDHLPADPWAAMDDMARPLPTRVGRRGKRE
jgi:bifunctional non-homologous end joining protein LigD